MYILFLNTYEYQNSESVNNYELETHNVNETASLLLKKIEAIRIKIVLYEPTNKIKKIDPKVETNKKYVKIRYIL